MEVPEPQKRKKLKTMADPTHYKALHPQSEPENYAVEIRQMMHGFGDCSEPLIETVRIVEEVVLQQMRAIITRAREVSERRNSSVLSAEDFLFLLRKNKAKLQRLVSYLKLKDFKSVMFKTLDADSPEAYLNMDEKNEGQKKTTFMTFLDLLDTTGELLESNSNTDHVKHQRNMRADQMSKKMDEARYLEFSKARSVSFVNKNRHKFSDWIGANDDVNISKSGYSVLSYLAYETVAQIVDLALLVRKDQKKVHGDCIDRLRLSYHNPHTYKPYQYSKATMVKPISPAEVNEALRRFWSPQTDLTGPFHRSSMRKPHMKFLAC